MKQISSYEAKELLMMAERGQLPSAADVDYLRDEIEALREMVVELDAKSRVHERALRKARKIINGLQTEEEKKEG